jgi:hypothetical protein
MNQEIKKIKIQDLVLWSENPRDPIDKNATDQAIIDRALNHASSKLKWNLDKLAKEMGDYYDFSELPTVVFHGKKPIVYDGNRRVILGKIKHKLVNVPDAFSKIKIPDFPLEIPCNVCTKETALQNVLRKHGGSGSWDPLERDIFLYRFMGEKKSAFLLLEEQTGIISEYSKALGQGFVRDEIFTHKKLAELGFFVNDDTLSSRHNEEESRRILSDIIKKITDKELSTRKNRGQVITVLDQSTQELIKQNEASSPLPITLRYGNAKSKPEINDKKSEDDDHSTHNLDNKTPQTENLNNKTSLRLSKRTTQREAELFGGKLYLQAGDTNDFYRDVVNLYSFYIDRKDTLSSKFPSLIRMSLRLLCETAAKEKGFPKIDNYLKGNYAAAKKNLDQDGKTTLSNQDIDENKIVQLLHTGAHNYKSSSSIDQTIALSMIIGAILTITHGKE